MRLPSPPWTAAPRLDVTVVRKEAEKIVRGLAGLARGPDDGAVVLAQHLEPGADVVGVPHGRHDAERRAAEGRLSSRRQSSSNAYFFVPNAPERSRLRREACRWQWPNSCRAVRCQLIGSK